MRDFLLRLFSRWGCPKAIRTDNGEPLGVTTRDVLPFASLWMAGYGICHILNKPRSPQHNAYVERAQGTTSRWAEVERCMNIKDLQARLTEACAFQRDKFPVTRLGNVPRASLHPRLNCTQRPFDPNAFDLNAAKALLAKVILPRKVSSVGNVMLYGRAYSVGKNLAGKVLSLKFDPNSEKWVAILADGTICKCFTDERFSIQNLIEMNCQ